MTYFVLAVLFKFDDYQAQTVSTLQVHHHSQNSNTLQALTILSKLLFNWFTFDHAYLC